MATLLFAVSGFFLALIPPALAVTISLIALVLLLYFVLSSGCATFPQMLDDVAAALALVHKEKHNLVVPRAAKGLGYGLLADSQRVLSGRVYFGGYSSGAHVAAALLLPRRASTLALARHGLPEDLTQIFDCVLYLSGVFGGGAPGWPAVLAKLVFGSAGGASLPSPLLRASESLKVGHVLIRCQQEAFGLPIVEDAIQAILSGPAYEDALRRACVPIRVRVINSNHWNMLTSPELAAALHAELQMEPPRKASIREKRGVWHQIQRWIDGERSPDSHVPGTRVVP
eukprot:scaffold261319_cov32-Tisochrysis_lutea.AAC.2